MHKHMAFDVVFCSYICSHFWERRGWDGVPFLDLFYIVSLDVTPYILPSKL